MKSWEKVKRIIILTAAKSSMSTTFTDGSCPSKTNCLKLSFLSSAPLLIECNAIINVAPSDNKDPPRTKYAQKKESNGAGKRRP